MRRSLLILAVMVLAATGCTKNYYVTQGGGEQASLPAGTGEAVVEGTLPPGVEVLSAKLAKQDGTELSLDQRPLPLRMNVLVQFTQAVEEGKKPAVQAAFALNAEGGAAVAGAFLWNADSTLMTFIPTKNLAYQTKYYISVAKPIGDFQTMINGDIDGAGVADLLVGSPEEGKAYIIRGEALGGSLFKISGVSPGILFGTSVAIIGDVNNDGYADIAISAPSYASDKGMVMIHSGSIIARGGGDPLATILGEKAGDSFGQSLAGIGDRDEDGSWDLLVGTPEFAVSPGDRKGKFSVYSGKSIAGGSPLIQKAVTGLVVNERLGENIASAGDIDGDGVADFAVKHRIGYSSEVLVFSGKDLEQPPKKIASPPMISSFSSAISSVPDIDADGLDELLIGGCGGMKAFFYSGKDIKGDLPLPSKTIADIAETMEDQGFGCSVASLRTGLGATLIVGESQPMAGKGLVYGYSATALAAGDNPASSSVWMQAGAMDYDRFGAIVARVGDLNGDRVEDFAVCSSKHPGESSDLKGKISIFSGAVPSAPAFYHYSPAEGFCSSVSGLSP